MILCHQTGHKGHQVKKADSSVEPHNVECPLNARNLSGRWRRGQLDGSRARLGRCMSRLTLIFIGPHVFDSSHFSVHFWPFINGYTQWSVLSNGGSGSCRTWLWPMPGQFTQTRHQWFFVKDASNLVLCTTTEKHSLVENKEMKVGGY